MRAQGTPYHRFANSVRRRTPSARGVPIKRMTSGTSKMTSSNSTTSSTRPRILRSGLLRPLGCARKLTLASRPAASCATATSHCPSEAIEVVTIGFPCCAQRLSNIERARPVTAQIRIRGGTLMAMARRALSISIVRRGRCPEPHTPMGRRGYDLHEVNCHVGHRRVECSGAQHLRCPPNAAPGRPIGAR